MTADNFADRWAEYFGLALTPLFEGEQDQGAYHHVLLDGGWGSFALSASDAPDWQTPRAAEWAWSSDLAHHVAITGSEVAVVRWDRPSPERFSLKSVEGKLDAFYGYLNSDRIRSTRGVVDHLVSIFRRTRSLVHERKLDDLRSVDAYLAVLNAAMDRVGKIAPTTSANEAGQVLQGRAFDQLVSDTLSGDHSGIPLRLHPELAVRHAGSEIFQEAHFTLASASTVDMFGYVGAATAQKPTRGSSHFTPPALARSISEQALQQVSDLRGRASLTVVDPACGSGSFLYEALRTLRRAGFNGKLELVGRDLSPAAISMARYTLGFGALDWSPEGGLSFNLETGDSLTAPLPPADVVLMNPPFMSWNAMERDQRSQVEQILGSSAARADLSMAFVTRALDALAPGGVLGTVLPASVMTLSGAEQWRRALVDKAEPRFIASLGEYGLFTHAMINVSALVLQRHGQSSIQDGTVLAVIAGNRAEATGEALRSVRRTALHDSASRDWDVFELPANHFRERPTWRLVPPRASAALQRTRDVGLTRPIEDVFAIRQGVRTGNNIAFVLSSQSFRALPSRERKWFRPAAMGDNLTDGALKESEFVFYPYQDGGLLIETETDLLEQVPTYTKNHLEPLKEKLVSRASIRRSNRADWWGLSERRAWGSSTAPRIVSKYFGSVGGFALDSEAKFVVVQGFAWFPKWEGRPDRTGSGESEDGALWNPDISSIDLLLAYTAIFNSRAFHRIVALLSSHVSGGQFDLSPRFMNDLPVPDLLSASVDERLGSRLAKLIVLGTQLRPSDREWANLADRIVIDLYGTELFEQI